MSEEAKKKPDDFTDEKLAELREAEKGARRRRDDVVREAGGEQKPPERIRPPAPVLEFRAPPADPQREARLLEETARAEARAKARHARAVAASLPEAFRWAEFGAPALAGRIKNPAAVPLAATLRAEDRAFFTGASGTGKTSLAAAASRRAAIESGLTLRFENALAIATARAKHPLGEGDPEILAGSVRAGLLVIDDLGTEELRYRDVVKELIFERHWRARATWVTTWMTVEDVFKAYGDGIARRIFQDATEIKCGGKS